MESLRCLQGLLGTCSIVVVLSTSTSSSTCSSAKPYIRRGDAVQVGCSDQSQGGGVDEDEDNLDMTCQYVGAGDLDERWREQQRK
jgi:hypothetical protein